MCVFDRELSKGGAIGDSPNFQRLNHGLGIYSRDRKVLVMRCVLNNMRVMWRGELKELIREGRYRTQSELAKALKERGFEATQASISRELKTQNVRKNDGYYTCLGSSLPDGIPVLKAGRVDMGSMVYLKTKPAGAPILAQLLDDAELEGVVATVAGNDTIFVVVDGEVGLKNLSDWVGTDALKTGRVI